MKEFTTITEKELLQAAWYNLIARWSKEDDILEKDPDNSIAKSRSKKLEAQCDELRTRILEIEQAEQH